MALRKEFVSRLRAGVTLAALAIVVTACGPAGSTNSERASSEPWEAQASTRGVLPSFTEGAVADLEAWIPDTVAGMTMHKVSMQGTESLLEFDDQVISTLLQDLGVSSGDVALAIGIGYSASLDTSARMFVFRAAGVESDRLEAAFKKATDAGRDTPLDWTSTSVAGKEIETAADGDSSDYLYVKHDVVVFMFTTDPDTAAEIVSRLP